MYVDLFRTICAIILTYASRLSWPKSATSRFDVCLTMTNTHFRIRETRVPASHKKNEIDYQKDIDRFVRYVSCRFEYNARSHADSELQSHPGKYNRSRGLYLSSHLHTPGCSLCCVGPSQQHSRARARSFCMEAWVSSFQRSLRCARHMDLNYHQK